MAALSRRACSKYKTQGEKFDALGVFVSSVLFSVLVELNFISAGFFVLAFNWFIMFSCISLLLLYFH